VVRLIPDYIKAWPDNTPKNAGDSFALKEKARSILQADLPTVLDIPGLQI
jgi:hypothetical protein